MFEYFEYFKAFYITYFFTLFVFLFIIRVLVIKRHCDSLIKQIKDKNVLIITAHPDDETMFFSPTILRLRNHNKLYLLCMSRGNVLGNGDTRVKELNQCTNYLNFHDISIDDQPRLQDGRRRKWDPELVKEQIRIFLEQKKQIGVSFDIIITFDNYGASQHPNHMRVSDGLKILKIQYKIDSQIMMLDSKIGYQNKLSMANMLQFMYPNENDLYFYQPNIIKSSKALMIHKS